MQRYGGLLMDSTQTVELTSGLDGVTLTLPLTLTLTLPLTITVGLTVDESMIPWKGNSGGAGSVPHLSFVKRKPEPLGVELKTVCDCTTGATCSHVTPYVRVSTLLVCFAFDDGPSNRGG